MIAEFNKTIQQWIAFLDDYSFETLLRKPRPGAWSMGQLYIHLLVSTEFFIEQAKKAAATDRHHDKSMHEDAKRMFAANSFPPMILEGPDNDSNITQPESKEEIVLRLNRIKHDIGSFDVAFDETRPAGKTRHPGLLYFSATEWLQFAEMHLRHHFLQKKRIDTFLAENPGRE